MNITKKIKEQGNQAGVLLAEVIDNTVELDLSQYIIEGTHIVVLSAPDDSYPDAIIDENIAKKALSWKTDSSKIFLSIKVSVGGILINFIIDKRTYMTRQDDGIISTFFVPADRGLGAIMAYPSITEVEPSTIAFTLRVQQYLISATTD